METETQTQINNQAARRYEGYIGVFDSGVGGISVLKELIKELPEENFLYFGDSANAPYGEKTKEQVIDLSMQIADYMAESGCKAIVIACNTATSCAAETIRAKYSAQIPIIGIEPALKPAAKAHPQGRILVMATEVTLTLEKYHELSGRLEGKAEFIPVACTGLAQRVEKGALQEPDVEQLLEGLMGQYRGQVDGVVLGCTHYPFVRQQVRKVLGGIPAYDGGEGTARELHRQLQLHECVKADGQKGQAVLESSRKDPETEKVYKELFEAELQ
ncbi:MAG: glutamate racemase [Eubacteriales bacterium]|nr:glutamate racemase [Eubacteriales bacterium]